MSGNSKIQSPKSKFLHFGAAKNKVASRGCLSSFEADKNGNATVSIAVFRWFQYTALLLSQARLCVLRTKFRSELQNTAQVPFVRPAFDLLSVRKREKYGRCLFVERGLLFSRSPTPCIKPRQAGGGIPPI